MDVVSLISNRAKYIILRRLLYFPLYGHLNSGKVWFFKDAGLNKFQPLDYFNMAKSVDISQIMTCIRI